MTWLEFVAQSAWRGTVILAAAFAAAAALRRGPAAVRHFVWTAALAALLVLPLAMAALPKWQWVRAPAPLAAPVAAQVHSAGQVLVVAGKKASQWPAPLLLLWMLGCAVAAARFVFGAGGTSWMVRSAAPALYAAPTVEDLRQALGIRRPVRVVESPAAPVPMMWGILRPVVVLPAGAADWQPERLRTVLLHELVHVGRYDLLAQVIGQAACCLYWFQPFAWMAARQLRKEREGACDDAVLNRGLAAPEYAQHLLDLVRGLAGKRGVWGDAPAMAEGSDLESRVRGLLDRTRNRKPLSRRAAVAVAAAGCAVLVSLASVAAQAQVARGALAGVVKDPSGGVIPGCRVTAKNLDGTNEETTVANEAGGYVFTGIPPGRYALEFRSPGFAMGKVQAEVPAGQAARVDANLEVGQISEAVTVKGSKSAPKAVAAPSNGTPSRIQVGGNVQASRVLKQVRPDYPEDLQQLRVQGTVMIKAVISKEGNVLNPAVVNTGIDSRLAKLALDAVSQWTYQPTLLNGHPVEVLTSIDVAFQLQ
ncbi:MAG TPA: M56 family metallopeptidase [Candidatus Acidoferrales bacterium]|nr:M56 family metallopeptidase [Candidatus Acidoferrales bacterium]